MSSKRFEDLIAWQKARLLAKAVYSVTQNGSIARDFGLKDQMQRAALSIMANVAEGQERGSVPDFIRFLWIAKASSGELRSHLFLAQDVGYLDSNTSEVLHRDALEVSKIIGGLIAALKKQTA